MATQNRQYVRGVILDQMTREALEWAEELAGIGKFGLTQGSYNAGGVAASAGTHDGGGAIDISVNGDSTATQVKKVRALRQAGFAAWRRSPAEGFSYHIHCIQIDNLWLSSGAKNQVEQWKRGLNGLADWGPDDDPVDVQAGRPARVYRPPTPPPKPPQPPVILKKRKIYPNIYRFMK